MRTLAKIACCCGLAAGGLMIGCEGRPTAFPNSDPNMRKTSTQFAADAARRFPYPANLPKARADGRVELDLMLNRLQVLNSSHQDWNNIDIWVNQSYVCHIPIIPKGMEKVETIEFTTLYNINGDYFTTDNGKNAVKLVEMNMNGTMYQIPLALAD